MNISPANIKIHSWCLLSLVIYVNLTSAQKAIRSDDLRPLHDLTVSANTGEKPQSKLWYHAQTWWAVLPDTSGTYLWKLDNKNMTWQKTELLSDAPDSHADTRTHGNVTHVLLLQGSNCELVSLQYTVETDSYKLWTVAQNTVTIPLDPAVETATIDIDSTNRMWLAWDSSSEIKTSWSDPPYSRWSQPLVIASDISDDDICVVTNLRNRKTGILWSNQNSKRFGFRFHDDGADPGDWSDDEIPASQSALDHIGKGMADDHLNVAIAPDGSLYAAVKTSYDSTGFAKIALLVRKPDGVWDDLYGIDKSGTRAIALLNETAAKLTVFYTASEGLNNIVCKETSTGTIDFGPRITVIEQSLNNVTSTKQNVGDRTVIIASGQNAASGVIIKCSD